MKRHRWTLLVVLLALLLTPALAYDDEDYESPEDESKVKLTTGYQGSSVDGSLIRVAEYEVVEPGAVVGLDFLSSPYQKNLFGFRFDRVNSYQNSGEAFIDLDRRLRVNANLDTLLHRLDHDTLGNLNGVAGIKVVRSTDYEPDAEYNMRYQTYDIEAEFQHPDVEVFSWRAGVRSQTRTGRKQALNTSHCTSCHTTAQGRDLDQRTNDYEFGAHVTVKRFDLDYELVNRRFEDRAATPSSFYELAYRPAGAGPGSTPDDLVQPFNDRVWFQNGDFDFARIPKMERISHQLKLRAGFRERDALNVAAVYTKTDNKLTNLGYDFRGYRARYTLQIGKKMNLNFFAKRDELTNDDYFVDLAAMNGLASPPISDLGPGYTGITYEQWINNVARPGSQENFTTYNRYSAMNRADTRAGLDFYWRPVKNGRFRLGYTYRQTDRDNVILADGTGKTTSHTLKAAWNHRIQKRLRWNNSLLFRVTDNPYMNVDGALRAYDTTRPGISPSPKSPLSTQYYELQRLRVADVTNVPTQDGRLRSYVTWSHKNWSLSGNVRYRTAQNKDLDYSEWQQDTLGIGVNLWAAAGGFFQATLGYDRLQQETEAFIAVPLMDG